MRHVAHESAGTLENVLAEMGLNFHYIDLFERAPDRLELSAAPGLVILGGPMNVDEVDQYPYLARELEWIGQALTAGLPTLGVCLGAQLLAKALGAKVYPNRIKEIGWYRIDLTPHADRDPLFEGSGKRITVFHWHGDTFDLPPGTVRLAQGQHCRNQAFRYGRSAYGLQFHLEMTPELIDAWLSESANCGELAELDYIDPRKIREQSTTELPVMEALADKVLGRFVRLCWEKMRHSSKCRGNACR
ncbi:MAG: glutamine amidotransferase [Pirellulales bacterium]|nr:glutamine amidotransferase [Pirellulales bacterium]